MYGYIYKTTNLINNKIYIGQKRSNTFLGNLYLGSDKYLQYSVKKYGKENFKVELLCKCDCRKDLNDKEIYYINLFNARDSKIGYNVGFGGEGGDIYSSLDEKDKKLFKVKCSKSLKNKICVYKDGHRKYIDKDDINNYINCGYSPSKKYNELKEKEIKTQNLNNIKLLEKTRWENGEYKCECCGKQMFTKYGSGRFCCKKCASTHTHTEETKQKLSKMNKLGICGNKGKHLSREHKNNISNSNKKFHKENKIVWISLNNCMEKTIKLDELKYYLSIGWNRGRIKGRQVAWNRGLDMNDDRVRINIDKRNETLMKKYNTLNCNLIHTLKNGGK